MHPEIHSDEEEEIRNLLADRPPEPLQGVGEMMGSLQARLRQFSPGPVEEWRKHDLLPGFCSYTRLPTKQQFGSALKCERYGGTKRDAHSDHPQNGSFPLMQAIVRLNLSSLLGEKLNLKSLAWLCLGMCAGCGGCKYVSMSLPHRDCGWFAASACNISGLDQGVRGFLTGSLSDFLLRQNAFKMAQTGNSTGGLTDRVAGSLRRQKTFQRS